ncbi:hypothetical protein PTTG_02586 [Puccinia triticina 1-1 BBBD Race 1]|uniref:Uncharacterized protein n=1 Tax=Puccinia triticina (isolate 1-1 / race 1 (BBBD)) TaxID=630390 RepID=A0A180GD01_PUCT1|nr:hypothetical protein PTTG_02586 [Puccinia triticina 1-1 BBBD Race 1]
MLFSIQQKAASTLGLAIAVSAAPLNERAKLPLSERGVGLGWLCHFDGPAAPTVDLSLNLPLMLGGLCAKVNYDYEGCSSFKPSGKAPAGHGDPVKAQSIDDGEDSNDQAKPKHHAKPKPDADGSVGAQSFNDAGGDGPDASSPDGGKAKSPSSHPKKPKHHGEDGDGLTGAQSFNDAGDNDKPKKNHSGSVGALGNGDNDSDRCNRNEHYSSQLHKCVNKSFFSKANKDSTCKNGKLDALLKLCLDVSILGLTKPLHAEATVLPFGPGRNGKNGCPVGQQLSSLLNVCIDQKFFSDPLAGHQCQSGWKLDLVLGICLDLAGCQNQGLTN